MLNPFDKYPHLREIMAIVDDNSPSGIFHLFIDDGVQGPRLGLPENVEQLESIAATLRPVDKVLLGQGGDPDMLDPYDAVLLMISRNPKVKHLDRFLNACFEGQTVDQYLLSCSERTIGSNFLAILCGGSIIDENTVQAKCRNGEVVIYKRVKTNTECAGSEETWVEYIDDVRSDIWCQDTIRNGQLEEQWKRWHSAIQS